MSLMSMKLVMMCGAVLVLAACRVGGSGDPCALLEDSDIWLGIEHLEWSGEDEGGPPREILRFSDGEWAYSPADFVEGGSYTCDDGVIDATDWLGDPAYVGRVCALPAGLVVRWGTGAFVPSVRDGGPTADDIPSSLNDDCDVSSS